MSVIPLVFYTGSGRGERIPPLSALMDLSDELAHFVPDAKLLFLNLKQTHAEQLVAHGHVLGWLLQMVQKDDTPFGELDRAVAGALEHLRSLSDEQHGALEKLLKFLVASAWARGSRAS